MSVLRAQEIKKHFSSPARIEVLRSVSLEVEKGSSIAITGKSGEGKSTLLHILGTLDQASSGFLEICGHGVHETNQSRLRNRHLGFVFQACHLLDEYTTLDNVLMPARLARKNTRRSAPARLRALGLLEAVGLLERAHFPAKYLSGGEKQRAAIARALCNDPDILLADEPSGNLDQLHSAQVHQLLIELTKREGKTLIVVTHDTQFAELCDRTYILKEGKLL